MFKKVYFYNYVLFSVIFINTGNYCYRNPKHPAFMSLHLSKNVTENICVMHKALVDTLYT